MSNIKLFQTQQVRTHWDEKEEKWYFAIVDVIEILTESVKPRDYWYRLKKREKDNGVDLSTNCRQLKMTSSDGKMYNTECADTETLLRIIQSIPSPKAEPFKRWLAKVGYERLEEIENPELASTTKIAKTKDAKGFKENKEAAIKGGNVAGIAIKELEKQTGEKVVTTENYLPENKTKELKGDK